MSTTLADIAKLTASNGEHVGDILWWSLAEARVPVAKLAALWRAEGMDIGLLPEVPSNEKAMKVAKALVQTGKAVTLKFTKDDDDELHLVIIEYRQVGDGDVDPVQVNKVVLFKKNGALVVTDKQDPVILEIQAQYTLALTTHTPDDVRRCLVRAIGCYAAIALREKGGIYWVPRTYAAKLRDLERVVAQIGDSKLYVLPVHNTVEGKANLSAVVAGSLETELEALKQELKNFVHGKSPREETLKRRIEIYDELKARATMYKAILDVNVLDITDDLDAMGGIIEDLIKGGDR